MLLRLRNSRLASLAKDLTRRGDDWVAGVRRAASPAWKPRVLFQISNPFGYDAQEPVIRALVERGRVEVHAAGGLEQGVSADRIDGLATIGVPHHALARARHRRFDAIVLTDVPLVRYWRGGRRVYLHHGSSFANRDPPMRLNSCSGACSTICSRFTKPS